jgi:hypothetical protein
MFYVIFMNVRKVESIANANRFKWKVLNREVLKEETKFPVDRNGVTGD